MREFIFTIDYERGLDPLMDVFIDNPATHSRTIACNVTSNGMWRLERIAGTEEALERLDDVFDGPVQCTECIGTRDCDTEWHYEVIAEEAGSRTVYSYRSEAGDCHSIPRLAIEHVGQGVLVETERRGSRCEWRLLLCDDEGVDDLFGALEAELRPGLTVEFRQLGDPSYWTDEAVTLAELPPEQQAAVEAAVEHGYYRTPRDTSLSDLAETLDVSRSTLQYRLQRAEAWIVRSFVTRSMGPVEADESVAEGSRLRVSRSRV
ncbi:helix-turn-helix domain-containing protein [Halomicroarcula limicola]|uniref:Helix-turn-helix domain-containing protein n=1 Tax=Haloarcula limicola TaxID=1429915 RepID=A0A8J7YCH6_9EURY|nr:helix-turn-helix domain-containing protein [Halomicroarcula limicola]MBV0923978.1 helix-turn-helix domain-containing protein [Halomicroarcula limicola]